LRYRRPPRPALPPRLRPPPLLRPELRAPEERPDERPVEREGADLDERAPDERELIDRELELLLLLGLALRELERIERLRDVLEGALLREELVRGVDERVTPRRLALLEAERRPLEYRLVDVGRVREPTRDRSFGEVPRTVRVRVEPTRRVEVLREPTRDAPDRDVAVREAAVRDAVLRDAVVAPLRAR